MIRLNTGMTDDSTSVDLGFAALADPVRRAIIARLSRGPATVNELAEPFEITNRRSPSTSRCSSRPAWSPGPGTPSAAPCT